MKKSSRRRYCVIGTGGRSAIYIQALATTYREQAELAAFCDLSPARMEYYNRRLVEKYDHPAVPAYIAADYEKMIRDIRPDAVIVVTPDGTHRRYVVAAMQLGCDVISEKPLTIDGPGLCEILETVKQTGKSLRVTFNLRYLPAVTKMRELIVQGGVGMPLATDLAWVLDTKHGADYFRRWHREKPMSGGLLVHKASHHFDMVNWCLGDWPETVFCMGGLKFYGKAAAEARGERYSYERYFNEPAAANDPFALKWQDHPHLNDLYGGEAERETGYIRDRNVFGEGITIEDTMAITARYRQGAILSYSLQAYSPWEGYRFSITGNRGRIELITRQAAALIDAGDDQAASKPPPEDWDEVIELRLYPMHGQPRTIAIPATHGSHGGSDGLMLADLFSKDPPADPLKRAASHFDGAAAVLMGAAANESMRTGQAVHTLDLCPLPARLEPQ